jgi:predicted DNA-binding protein with PD1-like motif
MKYSQANPGRTFVIRLEDGDILHESIEQFAVEHGISAAYLIAVGGIDKDSKLVVGPEDGRAKEIVPMEYTVPDVHEVTGTGTLFPDNNGNPILHMHIAGGRKDKAITGCTRRGVKIWHILEVILVELTGSSAKRLKDDMTGFELLVP